MNSRVSAFDALVKMKAPMYKCSPAAIYDLDVDYNNIVWNDDATPEQKPTKEQVQEKIIELEAELPMKYLRFKRDKLLKESDVYSLPDFPHSNDTIKQAWLSYRQALRILPASSTPELDENGVLTNITWPTLPS